MAKKIKMGWLSAKGTKVGGRETKQDDEWEAESHIEGKRKHEHVYTSIRSQTKCGGTYQKCEEKEDKTVITAAGVFPELLYLVDPFSFEEKEYFASYSSSK